MTQETNVRREKPFPDSGKIPVVYLTQQSSEGIPDVDPDWLGLEPWVEQASGQECKLSPR